MNDQRVLIVEDDRSIRELVALILRRMNLEFDIASDGQMAVDKLARGSYSLVILDLMIPKLSGYSVIQFIRDQVEPKPKVLVATGGVDEFRRRCDPGTVTGVIQKPFDIELLSETVRSMLDQSATRLSA